MAKDKTKMQIIDAFKEILAHKSLSKITVQEIADVTGIERQTFYYHFNSIEDMLNWAVQRNVKLLRDSNFNINTKVELYSKILIDIKNSDKFVKAILENAPTNLLHDYLKGATREVLESIILERVSNLEIEITQSERNFIVDFYNYGIAASIVDWIKRGMVDDPCVVAERIHVIIHNTSDIAIQSVVKH